MLVNLSDQFLEDYRTLEAKLTAIKTGAQPATELVAMRDELQLRTESLTQENDSLRSALNGLGDDVHRLRFEAAALREENIRLQSEVERARAESVTLRQQLESRPKISEDPPGKAEPLHFDDGTAERSRLQLAGLQEDLNEKANQIRKLSDKIVGLERDLFKARNAKAT